MTIRILPALLPALVGCQGDLPPGLILPFDGRSDVAADEELLVQSGGVQVPPDYPAGDLVTVVDLGEGGFVAGRVWVDGTDVSFVPEEPWQPGRRYAWTFADPEHVPHGPEMPVPDALRGTAVFSTADAPEVLAVEINGGRPCLVLSQAVDEGVPVRVTVDDVDVVPTAFTHDPTWDPYGGGAHALCLDGVAVQPAQAVRAWIDERGPWRHPAEPKPDIVARLFREASP